MTFFDSQLRMIPGVYVPLRSTLLQLKSGAILIAPIDYSAQQIQEIRALAPITDIVSPNLFHHKFVEQAVRKFPGANLWGPPGIKEKCPTLPFKKILNEDVWPYKNELDVLFLKGAPRANECVFFHKESRTLFVGDLTFNILHPKGFLAPLMFRKFGTYKRFAVSKMWNKFVTDKAEFSKSVERIFEWDFDRIVMCHGANVETGAKTLLRESLIARDLI